ncbi:MAG: ABC transporter permease [Xanthomonadales bacterium]|nr:ABC transporter permease [Xanthomonadales bacterium]
MNWQRLLAIIIKELKQLRRDRLTAAMILGIPTIQLLLFGFAINMDVRHLAAAVVDEAGTRASRQIIETLAHSQVADVRAVLPEAGAADAMMRAGEISMILIIPRDLERRLATRDREALQLIVDASDPTIQAAARQLVVMPLPGVAAPRTAPVAVLNRYNPERRSAINTVPGLIGVILTMTMTLFTAVAIVRERERGNIEMLIATPVSSVELILGKVLPFVLIGILQVTVVLSLGVLIFGVPIRGELWAIYVSALTYIFAALSLGVFLSTFASTQFQAMQMAFFTFLPQILLSGFMFPFAGMPRAAQWIAEILPLTHFIRLIRGIMLRAAELPELQREIWILLGFTMIMLSLATLRFRKRLD